MQVLDRINNTIGTYWGVGAAVPAGSKTVTLAADMPASQVADSTNCVRLLLYADYGAGPIWQATGQPWQGGPGKAAPSLTFTFPSTPPQRVYGVLENGTQGLGSPAICGLTVAFN